MYIHIIKHSTVICFCFHVLIWQHLDKKCLNTFFSNYRNYKIWMIKLNLAQTFWETLMWVFELNIWNCHRKVWTNSSSNHGFLNTFDVSNCVVVISLEMIVVHLWISLGFTWQWSHSLNISSFNFSHFHTSRYGVFLSHMWHVIWFNFHNTPPYMF